MYHDEIQTESNTFAYYRGHFDDLWPRSDDNGNFDGLSLHDYKPPIEKLQIDPGRTVRQRRLLYRTNLDLSMFVDRKLKG